MKCDAQNAACQLLTIPTVRKVKTMFIYWTCENIIVECQFDYIIVMLRTLSEGFFPGCTIRNSLMITSIPPVGIVCNTTKGYEIERHRVSQNGVIHKGCPAWVEVVTSVTHVWGKGEGVKISWCHRSLVILYNWYDSLQSWLDFSYSS